MKKTEGRRKIEIKKIEKKSRQQVTFSKRRVGLFNKASELSLLCGAHIAVLIFTSNRKLYTFGHPNVDALLDQYLTGNLVPPKPLPEFNRCLSEAKAELEIQKRRAAKRSRNSDRFWWDERPECMRIDELKRFRSSLIELRANVADRLEKFSAMRMGDPSLIPSINPAENRQSPPTSFIDLAENLQSPPTSCIDLAENLQLPQTSFIDLAENLQSPPTSFIDLAENLHSPPTSFIDLAENLHSPPTSFIDLAENLQSPPTSFIDLAENLQSPPTSSIDLAENLQSPPTWFIDRAENLQSPLTWFIDLAENLQSPPTSFIDLAGNLQSPPTSAIHLAGNNQSLPSFHLAENYSVAMDWEREIWG